MICRIFIYVIDRNILPKYANVSEDNKWKVYSTLHHICRNIVFQIYQLCCCHYRVVLIIRYLINSMSVNYYFFLLTYPSLFWWNIRVSPVDEQHKIGPLLDWTLLCIYHFIFKLISFLHNNVLGSRMSKHGRQLKTHICLWFQLKIIKPL